MFFLSASEIKSLIAQGAQVVDVRSTDEFSRGAAPNSLNLPLHVLPHVAHEHLDKQKPVVVYCMSGGRSAQAKMILHSLGFDQVHNAGSLNNLLNA